MAGDEADEWAYEADDGTVETDDDGAGDDPASESDAGDEPPSVPVFGRPLVRSEFYALVFGVIGVLATVVTANSALAGVDGRTVLLGAAAVALFGLAVTFARRPLGLLRATEPVPRGWYEILLVVLFGLIVGAVAATLVGG